MPIFRSFPSLKQLFSRIMVSSCFSSSNTFPPLLCSEFCPCPPSSSSRFSFFTGPRFGGSISLSAVPVGPAFLAATLLPVFWSSSLYGAVSGGPFPALPRYTVLPAPSLSFPGPDLFSTLQFPWWAPSFGFSGDHLPRMGLPLPIACGRGVSQQAPGRDSSAHLPLSVAAWSSP